MALILDDITRLKELLEKRKAFPDHKGRPGKRGGSLPKGAVGVLPIKEPQTVSDFYSASSQETKAFADRTGVVAGDAAVLNYLKEVQDNLIQRDSVTSKEFTEKYVEVINSEQFDYNNHRGTALVQWKREHDYYELGTDLWNFSPETWAQERLLLLPEEDAALGSFRDWYKKAQDGYNAAQDSAAQLSKDDEQHPVEYHQEIARKRQKAGLDYLHSLGLADYSALLREPEKRYNASDDKTKLLTLSALRKLKIFNQAKNAVLQVLGDSAQLELMQSIYSGIEKAVKDDPILTTESALDYAQRLYMSLEKTGATTVEQRIRKFGVREMIRLTSASPEKVSNIKSKIEESWDNYEHGRMKPLVHNVFHIQSDGSRVSEIEQSINKTGNVKDDLWHGTDVTRARGIACSGMQLTKAKTGRMLGDGIYASDVSSKCVQYIGNRFGRHGGVRGVLFDLKVALGNMLSTKSLRRDFYHKRIAKYDSIYAAKGLVQNGEWCIRNPLNVLPEYWIDIERVS